MRVFAGVDIGGTFTKVGIKNEKYVFSRFVTPNNRDQLYEKIIKTLCSLSPRIDGVGIACPGAVRNGRADFIPNLGIAPFDGNKIASFLGTPVLVVNDGDAAAYGESTRLGFDDVVMITLGTGVGGGIVLGGKLFVGSGCVGEIGHMVICAGGEECSCGMKGCFEAYASAKALVRFYKERSGVKGDLDAEKVFRLSDSGDKFAAEAVEEYIGFVSVGVINICNIFRPQAIIIGGGVSNRADLVPRVREKCERSNYGYKFAPKPQILKASLGDNAGVVGALELIKSNV